MKMRGYSVLFVCALCVFVLCGAAVAQVGKSEEITERDAKGVAEMAKAKGEETLGMHDKFVFNVTSVIGNFSTVLKKINVSKTLAGKIETPGVTPAKEKVVQDIGELEKKAKAAQTAVKDLRDAEAPTFKDQRKREALMDKMGDVVRKVTDVAEKAAAADIPTVEAAIGRAGELRTAADEAKGLWDAAAGELTAQIEAAKAAVTAINTAKTEIEKAVQSFKSNTDEKINNVTEELLDSVTFIVSPSLEIITDLQTASQNAKTAAEEAKKEYAELLAKADELKQAAERRKQNIKEHPIPPPQSQPTSSQQQTQPQSQPQSKLPSQAPLPTLATQQTGDYSTGPFCSLALPVFFFCWCVLFDM